MGTHGIATILDSLVTLQRAILALGAVAVLGIIYLGISTYVAWRLAHPKPALVEITPRDLGLDFRDVTFVSRDDGVQLRGWLIPGICPDGEPTLERTIIAVHGAWQNRTDPAAGLNDLCCELAHAGFAVLAFDMRSHGESATAPFTLGYSERCDVLGAVDFLREAVLPYPRLERPRWIGGLGISIGANALLYAAAQEPEIRATVADSAYAEMATTLARELPRHGGLPAIFTRGTLLAARLLFGVDVAAIRPVEAVAGIAPGPLLLIQAGDDAMNPPASLAILAQAARKAPGAHVTAWLVTGAAHAQSFHQEGEVYVSLVSSFLGGAYAHDMQPNVHAIARKAG
jgi:pimeloyl-ACP methyl ester carboxylesterase